MKPMDTGKVLIQAEELAALMRELGMDRKMVAAEITEIEAELCTIEHRMERPDCLYSERARLATQMARARRRRRELKDWLAVNKPYFSYMERTDWPKMERMLSDLIGAGRKVGKWMEARAVNRQSEEAQDVTDKISNAKQADKARVH